MKRDMGLIRLLLLIAEGNESAKILVNKYPEEQRLYHWQLLIEAGYVAGLGRPIPGSSRISAVSVDRLTWKGHELIDAIRSDEVWAKIENKADKAGGWTIDLISDLAKQLLIRKLGL